MPESTSPHNPCMVTFDTPAGPWRVDAVELAQAIYSDPHDTERYMAELGCPKELSDDAKIQIVHSIRSAADTVVSRQRWMLDLIEFNPSLNPWDLEPWQARLLYADLPRRKAIRDLNDATKSGMMLTLDSHYNLLCVAYGEETAESMLNKMGRFDEGLPKALRDKQERMMRERAAVNDD